MPALDKNRFVLGDVFFKVKDTVQHKTRLVCAGGADLLVEQGGQGRDEGDEPQGCLAPPVQDNKLLEGLDGGKESGSC